MIVGITHLVIKQEPLNIKEDFDPNKKLNTIRKHGIIC